MLRHVVSNLVTLAVVGLAATGALLVWAQHELTRPGPLDAGLCLRVEPGDTIRTVARALDAEAAITSPVVFRLAARRSGRDSALRHGSHLIPAGASMDRVLDIVTRSGARRCGGEINLRIGVTGAQTEIREFDPAQDSFGQIARVDLAQGALPEAYVAMAEAPDTSFRVIVAEGATSWRVVDSLAAAPFLDGEVATLPEEGSLAPASYDIAPGDDRADLIDRMRARQEQILAELWAARADDLPLAGPDEALTLASIIEKETGVADEQPLVASVFVNRLEAGMRLQMDATVEYGVTEGREPLGRGLRRSELDASTPYNTYQVDGLPPTPIANPGRGAIAAALDPAETDYLYFVADGTGGHAFAETLAEHNRNVARWREIEAERNAE